MGWASGSILARELWAHLRPLIPPERRQEAARCVVELFRHRDCDTLFEAETLYADAGLTLEEDGEAPGG